MATKKEIAIKDAARKIRTAWKNGKTIKPIRDTLPRGDLEAAYAVQQTNTDIWIKEGRRVIGRKNWTDSQVCAIAARSRPTRLRYNLC